MKWFLSVFALVFVVACSDDQESIGGPSDDFAKEYFISKLSREALLNDDGKQSWEIVSLNITEKKMDEKRHKYYYEAEVRALKDIYYIAEKFVNTLDKVDEGASDTPLIRAGEIVKRHGRMVFRIDPETGNWRGTQLTFKEPR